MKKVITYGTYDLLHRGHIRLLERAKALGDYLIVGITTDNYDVSRGKLNVRQNLMERINAINATGLADEIIIEEYEGQKIDDIKKNAIDIFAIGSDWRGHFDYLNEFCEVVYLERTKGISSTAIRNKGHIIRLGIVGCGRIVQRFMEEYNYVSGVDIDSVFSNDLEEAQQFAKKYDIGIAQNEYHVFLEQVDAVYIASPHKTHYYYAKEALLNNKHVLCETPLVLFQDEAEELYALAKMKKCVLLEALKTAYSVGFTRLVTLAKSGAIGTIKSVEATCTSLVNRNSREFDQNEVGGSMTEWASFPLLAVFKLLGFNYKTIEFKAYMDHEKKVDAFTKIELVYNAAIATAQVGIGVKSEGHLIISGTKGYVYVPSPWWKTEYFEARFENFNDNRRFFYKNEGEGLRYELAEFLKLIATQPVNKSLSEAESIKICEVIEGFLKGKKVQYIK